MATEDLRRASKALLGNMYRAEIGAAISSWGDEPLTALTLSDHLGIRYGRVQEELVRLKDAGLLTYVEQLSGNTVEYKAAATVYWRFCADLLAEITPAK